MYQHTFRGLVESVPQWVRPVLADPHNIKHVVLMLWPIDVNQCTILHSVRMRAESHPPGGHLFSRRWSVIMYILSNYQNLNIQSIPEGMRQSQSSYFSRKESISSRFFADNSSVCVYIYIHLSELQILLVKHNSHYTM